MDEQHPKDPKMVNPHKPAHEPEKPAESPKAPDAK